MNEPGDITFAAKTVNIPHVHQAYLWRAATGQTTLIPQPPGLNAVDPWAINNRGQVVIGGRYATAPTPGIGTLYVSDGIDRTVIASYGDPAPGGVHFSFITAINVADANVALNNAGNVAFVAATSTGDEAIYFYNAATKTLSRLAGIDTVVPGVGTIISLEQVGTAYPPPPVTGIPVSYIALNDHDQVAFAATVINGTAVKGALLLGTPANAQP